MAVGREVRGAGARKTAVFLPQDSDAGSVARVGRRKEVPAGVLVVPVEAVFRPALGRSGCWRSDRSKDQAIAGARSRAAHGAGRNLAHRMCAPRTGDPPRREIGRDFHDHPVTVNEDDVNGEPHEERVDGAAGSNDERRVVQAVAAQQPSAPRRRVEGPFDVPGDERASRDVLQHPAASWLGAEPREEHQAVERASAAAAGTGLKDGSTLSRRNPR